MNILILIMISLFIVLLGTIYQLFRYQFNPRFTNIGLSITGVLLVFLRQDFKEEYTFLFYFFLIAFVIMGVLPLINLILNIFKKSDR
jgi:glucan phosphoethanolaminetransferase (alkaline phosphatase superfamily)